MDKAIIIFRVVIAWLPLRSSGCSLERYDWGYFFHFFPFCAQHTLPPLVDYSKGQSKSGQAAIRKPIYLIWFMGYCTDWSVACQVVLVFIQVEKADHRENHTNLALIKPLVNEVILTNHTALWFYLCLLLNHHISCDVWLSYYVFSSFFSLLHTVVRDQGLLQNCNLIVFQK